MYLSPRLHLHVVGCCGLCFWHKPTELAHSFLFCSFVYFCLSGSFNYISFHIFSRQFSVFSLCSSGLTSALLVLSTIYLFMKVSSSPDIILSGWLGSKRQWTNQLIPPSLSLSVSREASPVTCNFCVLVGLPRTSVYLLLVRAEWQPLPVFSPPYISVG